MNLKVLLPTELLVDEEVTKLAAEAENGAFGMLPRHIDFVTVLVPGILSFATEDEREVFMAIDEGVLVKCGPDVTISTRRAVVGPDLEGLHQTVTTEFRRRDDREKATRSAIAKLEAGFVRRFLDMGRAGYGS
jgi:F-type H+-transporting ATPase subunit epsilon